MTALLENFNDSLAGLKKQLKTSRFLTWWLAELAGMAPNWMRSSGPTLADYVMLPLENVHAQMGKPGSSGSRALAITLPSRHVLRKTLNLPLATEENLRQVLEFQVEQHTPFPVNKIYFAHRIKSRDFASKQLAVELVVAPRDAVDPAIKILQGMGTEVQALFVDELLAEAVLLNLLPVAASGSMPSPLKRGANPWLAGLVLVLALAAVAVPPLVKREAVVQLLPWVEKGKSAAEKVSAVRRELETRVEQHNYLLEKRQMSPAVIQIMEELTHILPDDTWVQVFDLKGKKLQIQGETASSSRLIGLFEKSSMFREASFSSALFKGQLAGTERYQLEIQLRSAAKPDKTALPPVTGVSAPKTVEGKAP
jgi:general secretion pathway protein L